MILERDHLIAATLAAHAPEPKYTLVAIPGVELQPVSQAASAPAPAEETQRVCLACGGAHPIQQCPAIARFDPWAEAKAAQQTIAALRAQMDDAHQHVGALISAIEHEQAALDIYDVTRGEAAEDVLEQARVDARASLLAARAWLRRGEGE